MRASRSLVARPGFVVSVLLVLVTAGSGFAIRVPLMQRSDQKGAPRGRAAARVGAAARPAPAPPQGKHPGAVRRPARKPSKPRVAGTIVPDLIGLARPKAMAEAGRKGLDCKVFADPDSTRPKWTVTRQSPPAGAGARRGDRVIIWIAGMAQTPDLELEKARARALAHRAAKPPRVGRAVGTHGPVTR